MSFVAPLLERHPIFNSRDTEEAHAFLHAKEFAVFCPSGAPSTARHTSSRSPSADVGAASKRGKPLEAHDLAKAVHSDKILNEAKVGFRPRRPLAAWQSLGESVNPNATSNWLSRLAVPGAARSTAHRPCSLGQRQVRHACAGASECCLHRTAYAVTRPHLRNRPRLRLSGQLSQGACLCPC